MTTAKRGDKVKIHYTATFNNGLVCDTTRDREPLQFVLGGGEVIKGLDDGVAGMEVGDSKKIHVSAANAFGERNEEKLVSIDRKNVPETLELKIGMQLKIDIGRRSPAVPVTPPCVRVRTRRFGGLSYRPEASRKRPIPSKKALGKAMHKAGL